MAAAAELERKLRESLGDEGFRRSLLAAAALDEAGIRGQSPLARELFPRLMQLREAGAMRTVAGAAALRSRGLPLRDLSDVDPAPGARYVRLRAADTSALEAGSAQGEGADPQRLSGSGKGRGADPDTLGEGTPCQLCEGTGQRLNGRLCESCEGRGYLHAPLEESSGVPMLDAREQLNQWRREHGLEPLPTAAHLAPTDEAVRDGLSLIANGAVPKATRVRESARNADDLARLGVPLLT